MKVFSLNAVTKSNIEKITGVSFNSIISSYDDSIRTNAVFSKKRDHRKIGRGNPLLSRKRIRTMNDVNERLERIN